MKHVLCRKALTLTLTLTIHVTVLTQSGYLICAGADWCTSQSGPVDAVDPLERMRSSPDRGSALVLSGENLACLIG